MAISLADIKRSTFGPPRIVLYGVPGIGKTTFAADAPNPIFIPVEDGLGQIEVPSFPKPATYAEVLECIELLLREDHQYETVVLDSLDKLEPMLWSHVCATVKHEKGHAVSHIEGYGFGKGYKHATSEWRTLLAGFDALRAKGMAVILIAHSSVVEFKSPEVDPFDRYQLRLHKEADAAICDWADCVLFANFKVTAVTSGPSGSERKRGIGDGTRVLHTTERPAWRAKNRYRLPDQMALDWNTLQAAIRPAAPAKTEPAQTASA